MRWATTSWLGGVFGAVRLPRYAAAHAAQLHCDRTASHDEASGVLERLDQVDFAVPCRHPTVVVHELPLLAVHDLPPLLVLHEPPLEPLLEQELPPPPVLQEPPCGPLALHEFPLPCASARCAAPTRTRSDMVIRRTRRCLTKGSVPRQRAGRQVSPTCVFMRR